MPDIGTIDTPQGGKQLVASPKADKIASIKMSPGGVSFNATYPDGHVMGPVRFDGQTGTWTLHGPTNAKIKAYSPLPAGSQRYGLIDAHGRIAYAWEFTDDWIKLSATDDAGKVLL